MEACLSCLRNPYLVVHWISVESVLQSHSETVVVRAVQCMSRSLPLLVNEPNLNKLWISLASTVVICSCNFFRNWIGTNCTNYKYFASIVIFTNSSVVQWTSESVKIFLWNCLSLVLPFPNTLLSAFQILLEKQNVKSI